VIVYEVTVEVRPDLAAGYIEFMRDRHIPQILATGCFQWGEMHQAGPGLFRQRYLAIDRAALDRYFTDHAPAVRQDFQTHLPEVVSLSRAEWRELGHWNAPSGP
jgi:hypothetical protein